MRRFGLISWFVLILAFPLTGEALAKDAPCHTTVGKRLIVGRQPVANLLYAQLKTVDLGSWDSDFWVETFIYIGDVQTKAGKTYKLGNLVTVWGESCRATNRFFIFDADNKALGHYDGLMIGDPNKIVITGSTVIFPFESNEGNYLDLEHGPPDQAWLDGDTEDFIPAEQKHTH